MLLCRLLVGISTRYLENN